jgi:hypothetical protein
MLFEFAEKIMVVIITSITKINFADIFSDILHFKAKFRKYFALNILITSGLIILLLGLASYLKKFYVVLDHGVSEILIGVIILIISLIIYLWRR